MASFKILVLAVAALSGPAMAQEVPTNAGEGILSRGEGINDGGASDAAGMTVEYQRRYLDGRKGKLKEKDAKVVAEPINPDPNGELAALAQRRRADALGLAARVKGGAQVPADLAPKLRQSLDDDLTLWSRQFAVEPAEVASARSTWLPPLGSKNSQEWILARAAWYESRDQWIANRQTAAR